jgi:hypothetical protein
MLDVIARTVEAESERSRLERVIDRVFQEAENGEPWACRLLFDRLLPASSSLHLRTDIREPPRSTAREELARRLRRIATRSVI